MGRGSWRGGLVGGAVLEINIADWKVANVTPLVKQGRRD